MLKYLLKCGHSCDFPKTNTIYILYTPRSLITYEAIDFSECRLTQSLCFVLITEQHIIVYGDRMINWNQVSNLRNDVGYDEFDEIVLLFLEEVESVIEKLQQNPDIENLEKDMHFLKGSALNLGFTDFSHKCRDGEKKSAEGHANTVDIPGLVSCFYESKKAFLNDLPSQFK